MTSTAEATNGSGHTVMGTPHRLHVWLIGNPTSGSGKGGEMLAELTRVLECEAGSVALVHHLTSSTLPSDLRLCCSSSHHCTDGNNGGTNGNNSDSDDSSSFLPDFSATVIATDSADCGPAYVASRVADCIVRDRLVSPTHDKIEGVKRGFGDVLHVVLVVGGDGSLGEAVDGLCTGTLQAFERWSQARNIASGKQQHNALPAFTAAAPQWHTDSDNTTQEEHHEDRSNISSSSIHDGAAHLLWRLRVRSVLRHLLPPMVYIPSGTGADFAKLQLCCRTADEVQQVLHGVRSYLDTKSSSPTPNTAVLVNEEEESDSDVEKSHFVCYEVDVGRVSFVKSHRVRHFINVCSLGMSCDVVRRSARLRQSRLMTMAGGMIIFGWASIESLLVTRPQKLRIARLPHSPSLPSHVTQLCTTNGNGKTIAVDPEVYKPRPVQEDQLPRHIRSAQCALQEMRDDAEWCRHLYEELNNTSDVVACPLHLCCEERLVQQSLAAVGESTTHAVSDEQNNEEVERDRRAALDLCLTTPQQQQPSLSSSCKSQNGAKCCALHRWVSMSSSTLAFGNGRWYGGGLHVTPHADPTDNLLSCTNWVTAVLPFLGRIISLYNGRHTAWRSTTTFDGERFLVDEGVKTTCNTTATNHVENNHTSNGTEGTHCTSEAEEGIYVEADGELLDTLPAIVEVAGTVCFLAPRAAPAFGAPLPGSGRAALYTHAALNGVKYS